MDLQPVQNQIVKPLIMAGKSCGKKQECFRIKDHFGLGDSYLSGYPQRGPLFPDQIENRLIKL